MKMTERERFLSLMEYKTPDRVPNHEVGVWAQTKVRWEEEGLDSMAHQWNWFEGDPAWDMDKREYLPINYGFLPGFDEEILEETERYLIKRHTSGIVTKALKTGSVGNSRSSMDQYLSFPVESPEDFSKLRKRLIADIDSRYPGNWEEKTEEWNNRDHVLVMSRNCGTKGFYWRAREWMGTENLCFAWYDEPDLMHEMMEFIADFTIELSRPMLRKVIPDYVFINEDMAMKNGPLLSPAQYGEFIFPHMKRLVDFFKGMGVPYVVVDTDGNSEPLIPQLLEAGVDAIWPVERAAEDQDPMFLRKKYGRDLRLWGGVDKRELAKSFEDIDRHLASLLPMMEDGGFIPTVDHLVPPDVSLQNFEYYMKRKRQLLRGEF
jgi:uroporphyrinogen decarboxylase